MPELRIPKLSRHKASGQAIVRLSGRDFYLGPWGSRAARAEYDRLIAEWLAGGRRPPAACADGATVNELLAAFWDHAESYYRYPDGTPTGEIHSLRDSLKLLRRLYGHTPAGEFGPLALKAVRQAMIDAGWGRGNINRRVGRIKRVFKWGVENELIPPGVHHGLQAVAGLKAGRCGAKETPPVRPVGASSTATGTSSTSAGSSRGLKNCPYGPMPCRCRARRKSLTPPCGCSTRCGTNWRSSRSRPTTRR